jgi:hypothetical protein
LEYKSKEDYFDIYDYLTLNTYANLFIHKLRFKDNVDIKNFNEVVVVGVFNNISKETKRLFDANGYKVINYKVGVDKVLKYPYDGYLVDLSSLQLHNKEVLLSFLTDKSTEYVADLSSLLSDNRNISIINKLELIYSKLRSSMMLSLSGKDELSNMIDNTLYEVIEGMPLEIRLRGLKPEEVFKQYKPEEVFKQYKPEEVFKQYKPEDRLKGLKPEEVFKQYKPEEIEAFLKKLKSDN